MTGSFNVRKAKAEDRPAICSIVTAAFDRVAETRIVEALWADDAAALELVALTGAAPIGYCAFSLVTADPPVNGPAYGLAPVAVAPAHQNKGVGAALVEAGLEIVRKGGVNLVVVLGEPAYYERFGFAPASKLGLCWAAMDAGDAFQALDIAGLSSTPTRRINYHPAFEAA